MEEKKTMENETDIQLTEKKEVYQVKEKKSMRGENRKIYRMSDGSERAVFYGAPIHELDEETGSYEEAKNDITAIRTESMRMEKTAVLRLNSTAKRIMTSFSVLKAEDIKLQYRQTGLKEKSQMKYAEQKRGY